MTHPDIIIDQLLDEISRWRKQAQAWETIAHQLADAITKNDKQAETIAIYNRQKRAKYRQPRVN